ncbi:hypothetical protein [Ornithinimicrobium sp. INDO-MA30-4]|uniref:hypothetical protein n=1 Tax=Ornithinimicrobium sp. INDO-MA30-4 TaxID=2908651 RepID=UPI001F446D65|nr:hypothetical protein [Ornithinimicrobium sp. INDO-MA30-4]UJH70174.1 hypothetical protein L0A91_13445 [Ornithinimicrobium sp. INDO-MA30-4]
MPNVDRAAADAFAAGADPQPQQIPQPARSTVATDPVSTEALPNSMLLRFKGEKVEAQQIADLAIHHDRSKQYIAQQALQRGLAAMAQEARIGSGD